jgi:hypothetical protein
VGNGWCWDDEAIANAIRTRGAGHKGGVDDVGTYARYAPVILNGGSRVTSIATLCK